MGILSLPTTPKDFPGLMQTPSMNQSPPSSPAPEKKKKEKKDREDFLTDNNGHLSPRTPQILTPSDWFSFRCRGWGGVGGVLQSATDSLLQLNLRALHFHHNPNQHSLASGISTENDVVSEDGKVYQGRPTEGASRHLTALNAGE